MGVCDVISQLIPVLEQEAAVFTLPGLVPMRSLVCPPSLAVHEHLVAQVAGVAVPGLPGLGRARGC